MAGTAIQEQVRTIINCGHSGLPTLTREGAIYINSLECKNYKAGDPSYANMVDLPLKVQGETAICNNTGCIFYRSR